MSAADDYGRMVKANEAQRLKAHGGKPEEDRWGPTADRFRADPHRDPELSIKGMIEYLRAEDVVVDVGGGAGRFGLPIALKTKQVINVEPSAGMVAGWDASAKEAGITNASAINADWLGQHDARGDVAIVNNVTYFVSDIVPFIEKLNERIGRLVIIGVGSVPPPNQQAPLFRVVHGEELSPVPGHRELLPVLWDMGILPDVRVLGSGSSMLTGNVFGTKEEAIEWAVRQEHPLDPAKARASLESRFDEVFESTQSGFVRRGATAAQTMLIMWEPGKK